MKFNIKKALLTGTALVATAGFAGHAQAADLTLTGAAVWGTVANGMVATPTAGDNVIMTTNTLKFDTTETGVLTAGDITSTTGALSIDTTGDAGNVAFTIGSFAGSGAADITVDNLNASTTRNVAATFTGAVSTAGNIIIRNTEVSGDATVAVTVGGDFTVSGTGTTAISTVGTGRANATATLDLNGSTNTFGGAVTVTGGATAATNDAILAISGATTTFTGGLTLTDGAAGDALLVLDGAVAQTVNGAIAGTGDITISNTHASGVTFTGANTNTGTITANVAAINQAVTFTGNVASAISLGDNVNTDTKTATFGGSTATTVSGAISGGGAADTVALVFTGGNTVTLSGAATSNIDTVLVSGNTTLDSDAAITATTITIDSGSTLDKGAGAIGGAVVNNGTIHKTAGVGVFSGAITGTGSLDIDAATSVTAVTQASADIAAVTLTQTAASGYTVGTTNFSGLGTLALLGGAQTVTGNFTNTTDAQGTITITDVAGTTAILGDLGASTDHSLLALTVADGGTQANIVTTTGNLYVDTITVLATDTLSLIGTSAQTVSGNIAGTGIHTIGAGSSVTFGGTIAGASETLGAGSSATYNGNVTLSGAYTNNATATSTVAVGKVLSALSLTDTGSYVLNANDADGTLATADFGSLTDSGGGAAALTATNLSINVTGKMTAGTVRLLTSLNTGAVATALTDNSLQYGFSVINNGANTDVTVTKATLASLSTDSSTDGVATVLDSLTASTDAQIVAILDNVATAGTSEELHDVLESVAPSVDGGYVTASLDVASASLDLTSTRLASLRSGDETGMAAGNAGQGLRWWAQGFGQVATQDVRDGVDGYDADTFGGAVGLDTSNISDSAVLGVALSYGNTEIESDNANTTDTNVDSYQVTLYGDYEVDEATYVNAMAAYAWSAIDTTRHNVGGVAGLTANGDFDANQYTARIEAGRDYAYGDATLTPNVLASWTHYSADSYTETGAGGASLDVDTDSLNSVDLGIGLDAGWLFQNANGSKVAPKLSVGYTYDLIGDSIELTSTFAGGGAAFNTQGADPAQSSFDVGAAVTYYSTDNWEFTADYDFTYKADYDAHSGFVRAAYKF